MHEFISHRSAAFAWNVPSVETVLGLERSALTDVELTTFDCKRNRRRKGCTIRYMNGQYLPDNAVVEIDGVRIAAPPLLFLQMAQILPLKKLILFGIQLCLEVPNSGNQPLCTLAELKDFIGQVQHIKGIKKARRALKYIKDKSASITESSAYMETAMPHALGGLNIREMVFNQKVQFGRDKDPELRQNKCYIDLYIPSAKLGIEYMSKDHDNPKRQAADWAKRRELEKMGYEIIWIKYADLINPKKLHDFKELLRTKLGKKKPRKHYENDNVIPNLLKKSETFKSRYQKQRDPFQRPIKLLIQREDLSKHRVFVT